jgi:hypothetical protein
MTKREAKIAALGSCAAIIDVQADTDGDIWASYDDASEADYERLRLAFKAIATELAQRAARLASRRDR